MAVSSRVHVSDGTKNLAEEVVSQIRIISTELFHVVIKFTTFDTLNNHGIVDV